MMCDVQVCTNGGINYTLKCGHRFHDLCLWKWQARTCPVCRVSYIGDHQEKMHIVLSMMSGVKSQRLVVNALNQYEQGPKFSEDGDFDARISSSIFVTVGSAVGSVAAGSAAVGSAAVGSAAVGSAAVGAVGSAAVGAVGSAAVAAAGSAVSVDVAANVDVAIIGSASAPVEVMEEDEDIEEEEEDEDYYDDDDVDSDEEERDVVDQYADISDVA